jgi:hypothetical protein
LFCGYCSAASPDRLSVRFFCAPREGISTAE